MKKRIAFLLALALLTGCADNTASQSEQTTVSTTPTTTSTTTASTSEVVPEYTEGSSFIGQAGETLYNADAIDSNGVDVFYPHAYAKREIDPHYLSVGGIDRIGDVGADWYTIRKGDTFGKLTVTSAESVYGASFDDKYILHTQYVYFDGTVTLKGRLVHNDTIELGLGHELFFLPDVESFKESGLPVTQETKVIPLKDDTFITAVDIPVFGLGEGDMISGILDAIDFDERGTADVSITLDDICMSFCFGRKSGTGFNTADIASVERYIEPMAALDESRWEISHVADGGDIEAQLGYDTPVDVTKVKYFDSALEFADSVDEELREQLIADNYSNIRLNSTFVGSDKADWLYFADYYLSVEGPIYESYYSKVFYVKDGVITDTIAEFYSGCNADTGFGEQMRRGDDIIFAVDADGIYSFDTVTEELTKLCDSEGWWCRIDKLTEDRIFFADEANKIKIYYFESGEVFTTEIYQGYQDGMVYYIDGDKIAFHVHNAELREQYPDTSYLSLDLKTQEYTPLDDIGAWSGLDPYLPYDENEHYSVEHDALDIIVTDKISGCKKRFSLSKLWTEILEEQRRGDIYQLMLDGDIVYGFMTGGRLFALDIDAEKIYVADVWKYYSANSFELFPDGGLAVDFQGDSALFTLLK